MLDSNSFRLSSDNGSLTCTEESGRKLKCLAVHLTSDFLLLVLKVEKGVLSLKFPAGKHKFNFEFCLDLTKGSSSDYTVAEESNKVIVAFKTQCPFKANGFTFNKEQGKWRQWFYFAI